VWPEPRNEFETPGLTLLCFYLCQGKLTGAEADIVTWEERNTEIYRWLNDAPPPYATQRRPLPAASPRTRTLPPPDDQALVRMASVVHRAPALAWTAAAASHCLTHSRHQHAAI